MRRERFICAVLPMLLEQPRTLGELRAKGLVGSSCVSSEGGATVGLRYLLGYLFISLTLTPRDHSGSTLTIMPQWRSALEVIDDKFDVFRVLA